MSGLGGRAARTARMARLSAGAGSGLLRARRAGRRGDADALMRAHEDVAGAVLDALGSMKGAAMKLGQLLSYVDLDLDPELSEVYRSKLSALADRAPASDPAAVRAAVTADFGAPPEEVFATWDPTPLAVASIGQVHRATLPTGEAVAVKVQHPGIAEAIEADLANVESLARLSRFIAPEVDARELLVELRDRVVEEIDYQREAAFQQLFVDRWAGHPFVHVPAVHHDWCRPRVLVTELVEGATFNEMATTATPAERDRYGEAIFRFTFGSLYRFRIFNSDPHPGNFLFPGDGRVSFLDFGSSKAFSTEAKDRLIAVQDAVFARDVPALETAMEVAGLKPAGVEVDMDVVLAWWELLREPMLRDEPATYTPEYARRVINASAAPDSPYRPTLVKLALPPEYLLLNRITFGVNSLLARLEPTANWHRVILELAGQRDEPASALGEAEAAWLAARAEADAA
jgi:predicted unusual protein kinase regulating ubiquinone biosynthesis (AarF/ABC1/UbiB family)